MRIDTSGRLLVGTSSARSNTFNASVSQVFQIEGNTDTGRGAAIFSTVNGQAGGYLLLGHSKSGTIGGNTLITDGDDLGLISFQGNDGSEFVEGARISAIVDGTSGANDLPTRLVFSTTLDGQSAPTGRMTITNTGQVNITPNNTVGLRIDSSTSAETFIIAANNSNFQIRHPAAGVEIFNSAGTAIRVIADTGGVSLAAGATAWAAISDERLKTDLSEIENGLAKTASLRAVTGRYISDSEDTRRSFLIAQDVEAVLPEAVEASDSDELGLRYTEVIPLLVAALKESKERIETLEAKVAALEGV
jgi:hypothetical protein